MNENEQQDQGVERTEERTTEKVVQEPTTDEGGPLGNITESVTEGNPTETVVERTDAKVTEQPAESGSDD